MRCGATPSKDDEDPARWLWTTVIITTDATGPAGDVHERTPLILPPDRIDAWLDPNLTDRDRVYEVLDGIVMEPLEHGPSRRRSTAWATTARRSSSRSTSHTQTSPYS